MTFSRSSEHIHPSSIVSPDAVLAADVVVGPFCQIGPGVTLGEGVRLHSHIAINGLTSIGAETEIFPFASIGHRPQDLKYDGEPSRLVIGAHCVIRENVTLNPGTKGGGMRTSIGDHCLLMAGCHVAHDCRIGDHVIIANAAAIAGHCMIDDHAIIGGLSGVHQFVRIGAHAFVGAHSMVDADVIPFGMAVGSRARLAGLNLVGLKRRRFDREDIHSLRAAYRMVFASEGTLRERLDDAADLFAGNHFVQDMIAFVRASSERPLCLPRSDSDDN